MVSNKQQYLIRQYDTHKLLSLSLLAVIVSEGGSFHTCVKLTCTPHTRPLGQGLQNETSVTPVSGLYVPAGHGWQVTLSARERYVPLGQIVGSYVPYAGQVYPAGQRRHLSVPCNENETS